MRFLGEWVQFNIASFRNDVYLEGLSTTTETNVLVIDSNGLVSKSTSVAGDLTAIVAGTGLSGSSLSGPIPTLDVDAAQAGITSLGTLSSLSVTSASDLGVAAIRLTNQDVDQNALFVSAGNTTGNIIGIASETLSTGNAIDIVAAGLTTGAGLYLNIDDTLTATASKKLINIDYDKAGVTAASAQSSTTGLAIDMADAATNHLNGTVNMTGANISIDSANAQGAITQKGLVLNVAADGIGDAVKTVGIEMTVMDLGTDIKMMSHANTSDYCTIATATNGATTITTVDDDSDDAHLSLAVDGDFSIASTGIDIAANGTISNATWTGTAIASTYLDSDTAHLTTAQTFTGSKTMATDVKLNFRDANAYIHSNAANDLAIVATDVEIAATNIILDAATKVKLEQDTTVTGDLVVNGDGYFNSSTASKPIVVIRNTANDSTPASIQFQKDRGAAAANNDDIGMISFIGENDAEESIYYGNIIVEALEVDDTDEAGRMQFQVAESNGSVSGLTTGLRIAGSDNTTDGEVNVTIAAGRESLTTVNGDLKVIGSDIELNYIDATLTINDSDNDSATNGGKLVLQNNDGAAMQDDSRLGIIEFRGAENASSGMTLGSSIETFCDDAWSASENGARMVFSTTDANASTSTVLTLDSDKKATLAGDLDVVGSIRGKQIQIISANFKDDQGTTETFLPLSAQPEEKTNMGNEQSILIMPTSGNVKEIIVRAHYNAYTSENIVLKVYKREADKRVNGSTQVGSDITIAAPTQSVSASTNTRSTGEITHAYAAGDALAISMTHQSTGPVNASDRTYVTVILENNLNDLSY